MSNGKEVKPTIHVHHQSGRAFVLASDHDRIVTELKAELADLKWHWQQAAKFVMPGEFDTSESIVEFIKEKDRQYDELDNINMRLNETIARQAKVIEKLKAALEWYANATEFEISGDETGEPLADGVPFTTVAKSILKEIEPEGEVET